MDKAANVLALVRNRGEIDVPDAIWGDVGGGFEDWDTSELRDWEREVMGTVRCWILVASTGGFASDALGGVYSNSGGIWSGGGMSMPRAAAMIWCSAHESEKSFNPLQNGASRRSICQSLSVSPFSLHSWSMRAYHQLPHSGLAEVLGPHVDALGNHITTVDMFLFHTAIPFLETRHPFPLQPAGLPFLFRFPAMFERGHVTVMATTQTKDGQVGSTASA